MNDRKIEWEKALARETEAAHQWLRDDVVHSIDEFCLAQKISPARFSQLATGDRGFYTRLKAGNAGVKMLLMARVDAFIKVGLPPDFQRSKVSSRRPAVPATPENRSP